MVQAQKEEVCEEQQVTSVKSEEISEAGREGGGKAHEECLREVGQPYFVAKRWEDKSGGTCGGDQASGQQEGLKGYEKSAREQVTRVDMDVLLQNVQRLT